MRQLMLLWCALVLVCGVLAMPAQAAPSAADKSFAAAKQLYDMRLDDQAVEVLQKFIAAYPADARQYDAAYMLGRVYQRQQKYEKALEAFTVVVTKAATAEYARLRAEAHFQMAECYVVQKDYERAARSYGFCLKLSTDADLTARAQYWLAESLYQAGRYADALPEYQKVADGTPMHSLAPWALYSIGMIELRQEHFPQAIIALERVTNQYKDSEVAGEATLALGYAYAGRARTANKATATARDNDLHKAVEFFTAVVNGGKATPTARQQALLAMAQAQFDLKEYGKAATTYGRAVDGMEAGSPQALETGLWRAHALFNDEKYADAVVEYGKVANSRSTELAVQARYWLGSSWYRQAEKNKEPKAYQEAIAAFNRFLATAGEKHTLASRAALLVAFCYEDLASAGDVEARAKAVASFKDVLNKWPASREAGQADAGISRLTGTMSLDELQKVAGNLPTGASSWNISLRLAREQFMAGKYEAALSEAGKVLDGNPTGDLLAQASYLAAAAQQKLGKPEKAIELYQKVLAAEGAAENGKPASELAGFAQRGLTQAYLDSNNCADAKTAAQKLLAMLPAESTEHAEALMYLAEAYLGLGQQDAAAEAYQRVVKEHPTATLVPNAMMGIAWVAEKKKDRALAISSYRNLIMKYPDHDLVSEAFFRLGYNLAEDKDYAAAVEAYKNVPEKHRLADQAAYAIAWAYRDNQKPEEANVQFAAVAEKYPESPLAADSLYRIGEYWLDQKNYPEAMRAFNRSLDLVEHSAPSNQAARKLGPLVSYKLGVCAYYADEYMVAASAFGKVAALYPTSEYAADSLFWKAQSLEKMGAEQAGSARDAYLQYVTKYPGQALTLDAALGAGRTGLLGKQYATARTDLIRALDLCSKMGQGSNTALAERAKNVEPEAQYYLAQSYLEEKNYTEALKQFAAVSAYPFEPWYSRSRLQMARCSALTGDRDAAERILKLLVHDFPASDAAKDAPKVARELNLAL